MEFLIKPRYNALRNAVYFDTYELNALVRAEYSDKFGFYQSTFGMFSYMRMTKDLKFRIHYIEGQPLLWQVHRSCAWTPTGTLQYGVFEVEPCKAKVNEEFCYDEWMDSAFKAFLTWGNSAHVEFDNNGINAVNELSRTLAKNMALGARMTLIAGQIHQTITPAFRDGVETNIRQAYEKTANTCQGVIELMRTRALETGMGHLDESTILDPNANGDQVSNDGKEFTGSALAVFDRLLANAPEELYDATIEGGHPGFDKPFYSLMLVSPSLVRSLYKEWQAQKTADASNLPRIEYRAYQWNGRDIKVLFVDETAVIPLREASKYDQYLTGTSHFAYLTISGVLQLGASFADIPVPNESEVSVMIQQSMDAEDLGRYKFVSHALFASAINDTNFVTGHYLYAEPA